MSWFTKIKGWFMRVSHDNDIYDDAYMGVDHYEEPFDVGDVCDLEKVLPPKALRLMARGLVRASRACENWHKLNQIKKCSVKTNYYHNAIVDDEHMGPEKAMQGVLGGKVAALSCNKLLDTICRGYEVLIDNGNYKLVQKIFRQRALKLFKYANEIEKHETVEIYDEAVCTD